MEFASAIIGNSAKGKKCTRTPNASIIVFPVDRPAGSRPRDAIVFHQTGASRWRIRSFNLGICCSPSWLAWSSGLRSSQVFDLNPIEQKISRSAEYFDLSGPARSDAHSDSEIVARDPNQVRSSATRGEQSEPRPARPVDRFRSGHGADTAGAHGTTTPERRTPTE